jgi:hypothetical protein
MIITKGDLTKNLDYLSLSNRPIAVQINGEAKELYNINVTYTFDNIDLMIKFYKFLKEFDNFQGGRL